MLARQAGKLRPRTFSMLLRVSDWQAKRRLLAYYPDWQAKYRDTYVMVALTYVVGRIQRWCISSVWHVWHVRTWRHEQLCVAWQGQSWDVQG